MILLMKTAILGCGIAGLSLAHYLCDVKPRIIDPAYTVGGVMGTRTEPFFFERGPRTFQTARSKHLLELISDLGLSDHIIQADRSAAKRYILCRGKLKSPLRQPGVVWGLLNEWHRTSEIVEDESVFDFFAKRIGKRATERAIDALVTGIYAGDMHTLSMRHAFGGVMQMVEEHGSITKAFFRKKRAERGTLFTLKGGTQQLIDALSQDVEIVPRADLDDFDHIYCTIPYESSLEMFPKLPKMEGVFTRPLATLNMGWKALRLPLKAFGYLVPRVEEEPILGVVFDSCIFPQQNRHAGEVRLTVMMREPNIDVALLSLKRHLGIDTYPDDLHINSYRHAIAHYPVGYKKLASDWKREAKKIYPNVTFCGGFLSNPSVDGRISQAAQLAAEHRELRHPQALKSCT